MSKEIGSDLEDIPGAVDAAARKLDVPLQFVEARPGPGHFDKVSSEMTRTHVDALIVLPGVLFASERRRLVDLAAKHRLAAMYPVTDFVDDGGLMSYGPLWADLYRRAATYVDKILKGAKPADRARRLRATARLRADLPAPPARRAPPRLVALCGGRSRDRVRQRAGVRGNPAGGRVIRVGAAHRRGGASHARSRCIRSSTLDSGTP